jgi:hypothetical protein
VIEDTRNTTEHGDPCLTIVVTGTHDVYRIAHHLEHGQCEFAEVGQRTRKYLKRKLKKKGYAWLMDHMHGSGGYR